MAPISVTLARRDPPAAVVALVGEHDAYSAQRLEGELALLIDSGRRIVVDLRDTVFVDSTTLSVLLAARRRAEQASLGFALVLHERDYTQVHQLLDLTGLGRAFAISGKLDEALALVRAGRSDAQAA
ncbi:MAG TPA: STAS domain-containing protein [Gaiellaceae bacterium]|jgi:anti-anti-sigma factor|nr:STAS domain-containing protein [Gaiellaceae bacterium]